MTDSVEISSIRISRTGKMNRRPTRHASGELILGDQNGEPLAVDRKDRVRRLGDTTQESALIRVEPLLRKIPGLLGIILSVR
jgi:hypothetical protein